MSQDRLKRALIGVAAVVALAWSLWILGVTVRTLLRGAVHEAGTVAWFQFAVSRAAAIIVLWLSMRGFRLAAGIERLDQPRVKVWRVCTGAILLVTLLETIFVPSSRKYQADNDAQMFGMYIGWFLCACFGAWLIRSAFPREHRSNTGIDATLPKMGA